MDVDTRDYLGRQLWVFGVWEPNITLWVRRTLQRGDGFVDVGANLGYYSLLASGAVGDDGYVLAFEASPTIFNRLAHNVGLNHAGNVAASNVAVTDADHPVDVFLGPDEELGGTNILGEFGYRRETRVDGRTLDSLLAERPLDRLRVVKIDVEGAEGRVVAGMEATLRRVPATTEFVVEIWPELLARHGSSAEAVVAAFRKHGYRPYVIANDYSPDSYRRKHHYDPPRPLDHELTTWADVIFSRRHALS